MKRIPLKQQAAACTVFGARQIMPAAHRQMELAMRLPITVGGALMPDARQGYNLPVGSVLATRNVVLPHAVGRDIGCMMALSMLDIPEEYLMAHRDKYVNALIEHTKFGWTGFHHPDNPPEHKILSGGNDAYNLLPPRFRPPFALSNRLQLGTSGTADHFVEWGIIELAQRDEVLNIDKGRYVALLSHSGSRYLGYDISRYYTDIAKHLCKLPDEAARLSWLDMDSEEGQEYWLAMHLSYDYAVACHEIIHQRLINAVGGQVLANVQHHHNFARKEIWNGEEVVLHRKGTTPAGKGEMGIISGSMTAPGFLVRGKGNLESLNSAARGAGRQMGRDRAMRELSKEDMHAALKTANVTLINARISHAPMAYKDIRTVMSAQQELVDVVATFQPLIVRMAEYAPQEY